MNVTFKLFLGFMIIPSNFLISGAMRVVPEVINGAVVLCILYSFIKVVLFTFGISLGLFWGSSQGLENSYPVKNDIYLFYLLILPLTRLL